MISTNDPTSPATKRSRNVLVTFLGGFVRQFDNWMPIAGTIELTGQLGLDDASVRSAISRLKKRGWLDADSRDGVRGYRLTDEALAVFAAGDDFIWHAREPARLQDGWCIVTFSVPESARTKRHLLRRRLSELGFGNASSAVWIAPARMRDAALEAITEVGAGSNCAIFCGDYTGGQDLDTLVAEAWDLAELQRNYASFLSDYGHLAGGLATDPVDGKAAFVTYIGILDRWRKLPYRDPGLPLSVLPDSWNGTTAVALFEQLVGALEKPALSYASRHWPN